jgi:hypothetical protein
MKELKLVLGVLERTPSFFEEFFYGGRQLQQPLEIPTKLWVLQLLEAACLVMP